ncbi:MULTISPECIES: EAL domain-containing protein [unclassified Butyrivibrio]|uniref:EAL domain-containing protein n=1 Tax=unclassified Butyrivibrio TaxID=2639466 RepID=UPI0003B3A926|nr:MULTISPECIES: EAL domain-containing protein [unclassified Butyrivibrio]MDC7293857.1 EAL domain-containing protein [Butyrivibrio sp. DSM 10294]
MMDTSGYGSLAFRIAAAIISLTCVFYTLLMRNKRSARSNLFVTLLLLTFIDSITGIISYLTQNSELAFNAKFVICYGCKLVYFVTHFAFIPTFLFYIILVCGVMYKLKFLQRVIIVFPIIVLEILLLLNPFISFMFVHEGNLVFVRRPGIYVVYAVAVVYAAFSFYLLMRYWKNIGTVKRVAMSYFSLLVVTGTAIQMLNPQIVCELLADSIGLMGIMIMIEKDDDKVDSVSGTYNRNAFLYDLNNFFSLKREFVAICVRISDADSYRKIVGFENFQNIIREIGVFLVGIDDKYDVYRAEDSCFYILCPDISDAEVESMTWLINNRFNEGFDVGEGATMIKARILAAKTPGQFNSVDDIFLLAEADIESADKSVFIGSDLDFLVRKIEIEKAIGRGISEKNFKVLYQPMYNAKTGKITSAEALLTLNDSVLGAIAPEEFMAVADKTGFIEELEVRMIEAVFRFLGTGVDRSDMRIEFVLIHFMSIKTISKSVADAIKDNMERFKIDPSLIAFEINEHDAHMGIDSLEYIMDVFKKLGIRLFLGNYTSGYMDYRTGYNKGFDGMIIHVRNIMEGTGYENGKILINTRVSLLNQFNSKVIISRIDNKEQYDIVKDLSAHCLSGNYISPSMTRNELQLRFWHGERVEFSEDGVKHFEEDENNL